MTPLEFIMTIKQTKPGNASGPDGYTLTYYKKFHGQLAPHFIVAFHTHSQVHYVRPKPLKHTSVSYPKKERTFFRPISLINVDLKLFNKILATLLILHLQDIIHLDQLEFMPGREARDGTIQVLNMIHSTLSKANPTFILSTNAEKAFDRVDWTYLKLTLEAIGFGYSMMGWIVFALNPYTAG